MNFNLSNMISKKSLSVLRSQLPKGSIQRIRVRLEGKGHIYKDPYIRKVLNSNDRAMDDLIVDEARKLRRELFSRAKEIEAELAF